MLDHLSESLQKEYPGIPKDGEVRRYKLAGIKKRPNGEGGTAYTIPNSRSLPSSYPVIDEGRPKTIAFVERILPTDDPNKTKQQLGFIEFRVEDGGMISVTKENYHQTMYIDMFLWFSPFLSGAEKKPWYLKHKLGQFLEMENPEMLAEKYITADQEIHNAKDVVYKMTKPMMAIVVDQLKIGHSIRMTEKELRQALIRYCESRVNGVVGGGAKRIIALSEDKEVAMRKLIAAAIEMKFIQPSPAGTEMVWVKGGEVICHKMPQKPLIDSMIMFFVSNDGREVLGALKALVEQAAGNKKEEPATEETIGVLSDEHGPLKGSPEWDKLNPNEKGRLNKLRKEAKETKDTTIPESPVEA